MCARFSSNFHLFFFFSLQRRRMCSSLERLWDFHSIRCFLFFLFVYWCLSSKTRQFFLICSNNVNEFYSFIITINDNHQHDVSHSHSRSFTTYLLNVIPTSTTWCMASSVHFLHVKRRRTSKLQQQQQMERRKKMKIYELITTIMKAQEKWQWISSRSKERRGKKSMEEKKLNHMKKKKLK